MGKYRTYFKCEMPESEEDRMRMHVANGGAELTKGGHIMSKCLGYGTDKTADEHYDGYYFPSPKYWHIGLKKYLPAKRLCPDCTAKDTEEDAVEYRKNKKKLDDAVNNPNGEVSNGTTGCAGQTG